MLALPSVFVSGKYGWTPSSIRFRHCHCLKFYCCCKDPFLQIHRILRRLSSPLVWTRFSRDEI